MISQNPDPCNFLSKNGHILPKKIKIALILDLILYAFYSVSNQKVEYLDLREKWATDVFQVMHVRDIPI